ncbi:MAG: cytochrome c [Chloroflexi bacterium]|nr:cytochrome c [Chloroflexota bacterium]
MSVQTRLRLAVRHRAAFPTPWARLRASHGVVLIFVLVIWVATPLTPEEWGLQFPMGYKVFFSVMLALGILFFWFLGKETIRTPQSAPGVIASLIGVIVITIGILVVAGSVYPQFDIPRVETEVGEVTPSQRGEALFFSGSVGCFRCHTISGTGGTRGPDLTDIKSRAANRVTGLGAADYLLGKIGQGAAYSYQVPEYVPMMPAFGKTLSDGEISDIAEYLLAVE